MEVRRRKAPTKHFPGLTILSRPAPEQKNSMFLGLILAAYIGTQGTGCFLFLKGDCTDLNNCSSQWDSKGSAALALFYGSQTTYPTSEPLPSRLLRTGFLFPDSLRNSSRGVSIFVAPVGESWAFGLYCTISALPWNFKMGDSPGQISPALGEKYEDCQSLSTLLCGEPVCANKVRRWQCEEKTIFRQDRRAPRT